MEPLLYFTIFIFAILGGPIFAAMAMFAMVAFHFADISLSAVAVEVYRISSAHSLLTIPLFTFAGYLMANLNLLKGFCASLKHCWVGCLEEWRL